MPDRPLNCIYLDTNQLVKQGWPSLSEKFKTFLTVSARAGVEACLPEPVLSELEGRWRREFPAQSLEASLGRFAKDIHLLGHTKPSIPELPNLASVYPQYKQHVDRLIKTFSITVAPFTSMDLKVAFQKASDKEPPFGEEGKGFQDALIFWSVVEHSVANHKTAAFISNDGVFQRSQGELTDLAKNAHGNLLFYRNFEDVIEVLAGYIADEQTRQWKNQLKDAQHILTSEWSRIARFLSEQLLRSQSGLQERFAGYHIESIALDAHGTPWIAPPDEREPGKPVEVSFEAGVKVLLIEEDSYRRWKEAEKAVGFPLSLSIPSTVKDVSVEIKGAVEMDGGQVARINLKTAELKFLTES